MLKSISAVIVGVVIGVIVIQLFQLLGHYFYPTDISPDLSDEEKVIKVKEYIQSAPIPALLFVPFSYLVGSFVGSIVGILISKVKLSVYLVSAILLIFGIINLFDIPHPIWLGVLIVISFPIGMLLALKSRPTSNN